MATLNPFFLPEALVSCESSLDVLWLGFLTFLFAH